MKKQNKILSLAEIGRVSTRDAALMLGVSYAAIYSQISDGQWESWAFGKGVTLVEVQKKKIAINMVRKEKNDTEENEDEADNGSCDG